MDTKSYLPEYQPTPQASDVVRTTVLPDGRRARENVTSIANEDGSTEYVHEILEEVVPMRVTERICVKTKEIPVEERRERIGPDGAVVTTEVRSLDTKLLTCANAPKVITLDDIVNEIKNLRNQRGSCTKESTFMDKATSLWGSKKKAAVESIPTNTPVPAQSEGSSFGEFGVTTIMWVVFAIVAGLVTYSLL